MEPPKIQMPRFWVAVQPTIIRLYKLAGLVALTAILVGLIGFLVVNVFYFFDHTWVRPVVLSPTHQKVVEASTALADAKLHASQLDTEKLELEAQLGETERSAIVADKFIADTGALNAKTAEAALLRRELDRARLERDNAGARKLAVKQRLESIGLRIKDESEVVQRLASSPYLRAVEKKVVIAFVPYPNLKNVHPGTKLYGCAWGLVFCTRVGTVKAMIEGEVQDVHPHDESIQRGVMVEIDLTNPSAAGEAVLFAGAKPLWFL
jgi:hypothetical protein